MSFIRPTCCLFVLILCDSCRQTSFFLSITLSFKLCVGSYVSILSIMRRGILMQWSSLFQLFDSDHINNNCIRWLYLEFLPNFIMLIVLRDYSGTKCLSTVISSGLNWAGGLFSNTTIYVIFYSWHSVVTFMTAKNVVQSMLTKRSPYESGLVSRSCLSWNVYLRMTSRFFSSICIGHSCVLYLNYHSHSKHSLAVTKDISSVVFYLFSYRIELWWFNWVSWFCGA